MSKFSLFSSFFLTNKNLRYLQARQLLTLLRWGSLSTKTFHPSASMTRAQLRVVATTVKLSDLYDLSQYWLDKIRKAFSS